VINRGVERRDVYLNDEDRGYFLEIISETAELFDFEVCSFCLMNNHYHLLIETKSDNLSLIMRQINSKYGMYFNGKYRRIGHLWQGRFKSWYVYDQKYLNTLIKYIEFNPVKAGITKKIGEYPWAMSAAKNNVKFFTLRVFPNGAVLNYELLEEVDFDLGLSDDDVKEFDEFNNSKLELKDNKVVKVVRRSLDHHFADVDREAGIVGALKDGYTQVAVGEYLGLSNIAISKIYNIYGQKVKLFNRLREAGVFWSYAKDLSYEQAGAKLFIEYLLKYGDFNDIKAGFKLFGKRMVKQVWQSSLVSNRQFVKLNVMLAKVFFDMDVDSGYFSSIKNERYEKFRMLAS
jgi:REP element-mobilizing transposase RayT